MKPRITSAAVASALALSLMASASFAGTTAAETHAYFEAQRQLTDGNAAPAPAIDDSRARRGIAAAPSASDRQFLFQLGRTDGNVEPLRLADPAWDRNLTWGAGAFRVTR